MYYQQRMSNPETGAMFDRLAQLVRETIEIPNHLLPERYRDGETWYDYDGDYGQELRRFVEVITATAISDEARAAKASYFERHGTANE